MDHQYLATFILYAGTSFSLLGFGLAFFKAHTIWMDLCRNPPVQTLEQFYRVYIVDSYNQIVNETDGEAIIKALNANSPSVVIAMKYCRVPANTLYYDNSHYIPGPMVSISIPHVTHVDGPIWLPVKE